LISFFCISLSGIVEFLVIWSHKLETHANATNFALVFVFVLVFFV